MKNEFISHMPAEDYHKIEALSASSAKVLLKSASHYLAMKEESFAPTAAMKLGTVVHTLILEPEKFEAEVAVSPNFDKRTKFGKQAAEEFDVSSNGKLVIDTYTHERAMRIADSVRSHPFFKANVKGGKAETTMLWEQYDCQCKARVDYLLGKTIFDVKTCQDASPAGFAKQIATYSYHIQAAHYSMGFRRLFNKKLDSFIFLAVESEKPHSVGIYRLNKESLEEGARLMAKAANAYQQVLMGKPKPFYTEDLMEISIPDWALPQPFAE